jgi:hypothetical protein
MAQFEEKTYISQFHVYPSGCIGVRKNTDVLKDGVVVVSKYWRCVLPPNDPQASAVLDEPYYASLAQAAWTPEVVAAYQAHMAAQQP